MAGTQGRTSVSPASALHAGLHDALPQIARTVRDPWWIIGSAAMALAGIPGIVPQDIDVLCSRNDALRLREAWIDHVDAQFQPADEARFRSAFSRFTHLPMPLEVMGGLEVMTPSGWQALRVHDDLRLDIADILALGLTEGLIRSAGFPQQVEVLAALAKVTHGLSPKLRQLLRDCADALTPARPPLDYTDAPLIPLLSAVRLRQTVRMDYDSASGGTRSWRTVDPYAVEQRDGSALQDVIADDFIGPGGLDRSGARRMAHATFLRYRDVGVNLGPLDIELRERHATVRFAAVVTGGAGLFPESGQVYDVETGWRLVDGEWRLVNAEWKARL